MQKQYMITAGNLGTKGKHKEGKKITCDPSKQRQPLLLFWCKSLQPLPFAGIHHTWHTYTAFFIKLGSHGTCLFQQDLFAYVEPPGAYPSNGLRRGHTVTTMTADSMVARVLDMLPGILAGPLFEMTQGRSPPSPPRQPQGLLPSRQLPLPPPASSSPLSTQRMLLHLNKIVSALSPPHQNPPQFPTVTLKQNAESWPGPLGRTI